MVPVKSLGRRQEQPVVTVRGQVVPAAVIVPVFPSITCYILIPHTFRHHKGTTAVPINSTTFGAVSVLTLLFIMITTATISYN